MQGRDAIDRGGVAALGRGRIPFESLGEISRDAKSAGVETTDGGLRAGEPHVGRHAIMPERLGVALPHAKAVFMENADIETRDWIARIGGVIIPAQRLPIIAFDAKTMVVEKADVVTGGGMAEGGGGAIEFKRPLVIALNAQTVVMGVTQPGQPIAITAIGRSPEPGQRCARIGPLAVGPQKVNAQCDLRMGIARLGGLLQMAPRHERQSQTRRLIRRTRGVRGWRFRWDLGAQGQAHHREKADRENYWAGVHRPAHRPDYAG